MKLKKNYTKDFDKESFEVNFLSKYFYFYFHNTSTHTSCTYVTFSRSVFCLSNVPRDSYF